MTADWVGSPGRPGQHPIGIMTFDYRTGGGDVPVTRDDFSEGVSLDSIPLDGRFMTRAERDAMRERLARLEVGESIRLVSRQHFDTGTAEGEPCFVLEARRTT